MKNDVRYGKSYKCHWVAVGYLAYFAREEEGRWGMGNFMLLPSGIRRKSWFLSGWEAADADDNKQKIQEGRI